MAIRGRRYPPKSPIHSIIISRQVPPRTISWNRNSSALQTLLHRIQMQTTQITSNTPGPPIAAIYKRKQNYRLWQNLPHITIHTSPATSNSSAIIIQFRQHRPSVVTQNYAHRVTVINPAVQPVSRMANNPIYSRPQIINRPVNRHTNLVSIINPPKPQIVRPPADIYKLHHYRQNIHIITPNRRGQ